MNRDILIDILETAGVWVKQSGKNVSHDCVAISCPFCGNDPDTHCNINTEREYYFCWRDSDHHGKLRYLLRELQINVAFESPTPDEWFPQAEPTETVKQLKWSTAFKPLISGTRYWDYIAGRGFTAGEVTFIRDRFNVHYANLGEWAGRIIFPVMVREQIVSWVGRDIHKDSKLPYRESSIGDSILPPRDCLFNFDYAAAQPNMVVIITEGIFDCIRVDLAAPYGMVGTALLTKRLKSSGQLMLLSRLAEKGCMFVVMLDRDAIPDAYHLAESLRVLLRPVGVVFVPAPFKDPGEMNKMAIKKALEDILWLT